MYPVYLLKYKFRVGYQFVSLAQALFIQINICGVFRGLMFAEQFNSVPSVIWLLVIWLQWRDS